MSYLLAGHDLTKNIHQIGQIGDTRMFEKLIRYEKAIIRVRAAITETGVRITISTVYGYEGIAEPLLDRYDLPLVIHGKPVGYADRASRQRLLNGQGPAPFEVYHDFRTRKTTIINDTEFQSNQFIPTGSNGTGGLWAYFGVTHHGPLPTIDLYQVGNYSGVWLHADGTPLLQSEYPKAYMNSHWHRDSKGYIKYSSPSDPWMDRGGRDQHGKDFQNPDGRHLSIYCAPLEAARRDPTNPSLQIITEDIARRLMWAFPEEDLGYFRFKPGAERRQGRILLVSDDAVQALRAQGNYALADELLIHVAKREVYAHKVWRDRLKSGRLPFSGWGDLVSPAEVGIHYWGLRAIRNLFPESKGPFIDELDWMLKTCAEFCFKWTKRWESSGQVWYAPPYRINQVTGEDDGPSNGMHFCWMAAVSVNSADTEKMKAIAEMAFEKRFMEW